MICDNCGEEIDNRERYCPNCGMELPTSKSSKKKNYRNSQQFTRDSFQSKKNRNYSNEEYSERRPSRRENNDPSDFAYDIPHPKADYANYNEEEDYKRKPLKRKYYGSQSASRHYGSHDDIDYESYYDYGEEEVPETKKSRISLGTICLFMIMILLLGFVIGLMLFSNTQVIPSVPGFNS